MTEEEKNEKLSSIEKIEDEDLEKANGGLPNPQTMHKYRGHQKIAEALSSAQGDTLSQGEGSGIE